MEISLLQNMDDILFSLPLLKQAIMDGHVVLASNLSRRISHLFLEISVLIDAPEHSNLSVALSGLVETCVVLNQCFKDGLVMDRLQLSALVSVTDTLREIKLIIASSAEGTLNQNLEGFFNTDNGYSAKLMVIFFYSLIVVVGISAGIDISTDFPFDRALAV